MDNLAIWMAHQLCPLLSQVGFRVCAPVGNQYLLGIAGWIFCGAGLLMLMGIAEHVKIRIATRAAVLSPSQSRSAMPDKPEQQIDYSQSVARPMHRYRRLRHIRRFPVIGSASMPHKDYELTVPPELSKRAL